MVVIFQHFTGLHPSEAHQRYLAAKQDWQRVVEPWNALWGLDGLRWTHVGWTPRQPRPTWNPCFEVKAFNMEPTNMFPSSKLKVRPTLPFFRVGRLVSTKTWWCLGSKLWIVTWIFRQIPWISYPMKSAFSHIFSHDFLWPSVTISLQEC